MAVSPQISVAVKQKWRPMSSGVRGNTAVSVNAPFVPALAGVKVTADLASNAWVPPSVLNPVMTSCVNMSVFSALEMFALNTCWPPLTARLTVCVQTKVSRWTLCDRTCSPTLVLWVGPLLLVPVMVIWYNPDEVLPIELIVRFAAAVPPGVKVRLVVLRLTEGMLGRVGKIVKDSVTV